jgi:hypothetical protein
MTSHGKRSRRFSPAAIAALRRAEWNPAAERLTDLLAGGFFWSDENLHEVTNTGIREDFTAERMLVAYRASLAMGTPRETLSEPWEQVTQEAPDWPGLRPERRSAALGDEIETNLLTEYEGFLRLMADRDGEVRA